MATRDLSDYDPEIIPSSGNMVFGIVVSDWNREVTWKLLDGAVSTLKKHGTPENNIIVEHVPGSFELPLGAQLIKEFNNNVDAVICLGTVVKGETPHFDYVCQGVTNGIMRLNIKHSIPFIFGVLTTGTMQQALDRSGGKHGNKGDEAAITAIRMVYLNRKVSGRLP